MMISRACWPEPGMRVGGYEIVALLGEGGMASVFEARNVRLQKRVAIKVVHAAIARTPVAFERMVREGRTASAIRHPNIVEIYEIGEHEGVPYLVMELIEGEDMAQQLRRAGRMEPTALVDCMLPVISAIGAAHDAGVIHRDLKPSNIRLSRRRSGALVPKVVDFGISKFVDDAQQGAVTRTDAVLGTLHYLSPEQTRGAKHATAKSDQYAIGVLLYEAATGHLPFEGGSSYELMHAIVTAPFAPPRAIVPELPALLDEAIVRAMSRDPEARFESMRALGRALLPLASPRAAERWEAELDEARSSARIPSRAPSDPPAQELATLGGTFVSGEHAPRARRSRVWTGGAAAVAGASLLAALFAVRWSPSARAVAALEPKHARELAVPIAPSAEPERAPETVTPPPSAAAVRHVPHAPRRVQPSPAIATASAAAPSPVLGRNNAPILE